MQAPSFRSRLKQTFSPEGYLSIHIVLGVLLMSIFVWAFGYLAEDVMGNDPIVQFDKAVVLAIHQNSNPTLVQLMRTISLAGSEVPAIVTVLLAIYFIWRRRWYNVLLFVLVVGGGEIVDALFKQIFQRLRPTFVDPITTATGFSFPSGHAMESLVFYGLLAYLLLEDNKKPINRFLITVIFILIVSLIGFSRIYLGVHYPSDVVGGYIAGFAWLILSISGINIFRVWRQTGQPPAQVL